MASPPPPKTPHNQTITITPLPSAEGPKSTPQKPHHISSPPKAFTNPWPSFTPTPLRTLLWTLLWHPEKNYTPVPRGPNGTRSTDLVSIRKPTWGRSRTSKLRATWLGHASFLVETPTRADSTRGITILFDPFFSPRTSPVSFLGPKRYTPPPCTLSELPEIDIVCISHNHYDHLDLATIRALRARPGGERTRFFVPVGNRNWFERYIPGVEGDADAVVEADWWDACEVKVQGVGSVKVTCCPAQHNSGRGLWDQDRSLWCGWTVETGLEEDLPADEQEDEGGSLSLSDGDKISPPTTGTPANPVSYKETTSPPEGEKPTSSSSASEPPSPSSGETPTPPPSKPRGKTLYFAGDTGYQAPTSPTSCPIFTQIGQYLGPFDLALLPIGLCTPASTMGSYHTTPAQALEIHFAVRANLSIGMHYGTVRGGVSARFEDVREPGRRWREVALERGVWCGGGVEKEGGEVRGDKGVGLCDVGETVGV